MSGAFCNGCGWKPKRKPTGNARAYVHKDSTIITDEWSGYQGLGEDCGPVFVTTNTAESYFAILKRAHYGTHHQMSAKHLSRYVDECAFKWNTRKVSDGERMVTAIEGAEGKRLMYREPA